MAPTSKDAATINVDDKLHMLKEALKCVNGTLDFEKLATKMGVANGEAMRKRFKRFFEKDEEAILIVGSILGGGSDDAASPKMPRTPKSNTNASSADEEILVTPKAKTAAKKRKVVDDGNVQAGHDDSRDTPKSPKKRSKAIRSEKSTPKSSKTTEPTKGTKVNGKQNGRSTQDLHGGSEHGQRMGSPEVQAKVDATVKENEKAIGSSMNEPEKQAIRDNVEKTVSSNES